MKLIILFLLISLNVFGQASNPNDTLKIGKKSSSADKGLVFETNDGVSNKTLKVNPTSKALIFSGNDMQIGDGATGNDKGLVVDPSSGAGLKWDGTKSKLQFSNDGSTYKDIGSGSGGGASGINGFTADQNAGAEDALAGWTASAGTFALESADAIVGENSFTWVPALQNDTLDSPVLVFDKDSFKGRACEANIEYIGGDENLTLQVIDADNDVLASQVLSVHGITSKESVFFLCPSTADIALSANNGNLRLRLLNEGATASAIIKWDSSYTGTLQGLIETTLPDVFSARIDQNGVDTATVQSESSNFIDGSTCNWSAGTVTCDFVPGLFTQNPACSCSVMSTSTGTTCQSNPTGTSSITIKTVRYDGALVPADFDLFCQKQGADAKQSVQVYKSIPKVSENINTFGILIEGAGGTIQDSYGGIISSCSKIATGIYACSWGGTGLTELPVCTATPEQTADFNRSHVINHLNFSGFQVNTFTLAATAADITKLYVNCTKTGNDFKMPTVQPVIVGQVVNSYADSNSKNLRVESCYINDAGGTPTAGNVLCNSWIDSFSDFGSGLASYFFKPGIFSDTPVCTCSANSAGSDTKMCSIRTSNTTQVSTQVANSSGVADDRGVNLICVGRR